METSRRKKAQIQKNLFTMKRYVGDQNMVIRWCVKRKLDGLESDWVVSGLGFLLK